MNVSCGKCYFYLYCHKIYSSHHCIWQCTRLKCHCGQKNCHNSKSFWFFLRKINLKNIKFSLKFPFLLDLSASKREAFCRAYANTIGRTNELCRVVTVRVQVSISIKCAIAVILKATHVKDWRVLLFRMEYDRNRIFGLLYEQSSGFMANASFSQILLFDRVSLF